MHAANTPLLTLAIVWSTAVGCSAGDHSEVSGIIDAGGETASGGINGKGGGVSGGMANGGATGSVTGGNTAGGAVTGGNAAGGSSSSCGDAPVMARYAACSVAANAQSCADLGGTWTQRPPAGPTMFCRCPSGDGGCSCAKRSQCIVDCIAPLPTSSVCTGTTSWQCADAPQLNCWCSLQDSGNPVAMCS